MIRRWCLLSLVLLLQACSAVKLGYHQLPTIGYWWLDAHLSFTDSQTGEVRQALSQLHSWHRQQELPVYASWLGALAAQSSNTREARREKGRLCSQTVPGPDSRARNRPSPPNSAVLILPTYWISKLTLAV